ncbi:MAG: YitT family protein [Cellulosilyticaceae bacterium]
MKYIQSMRHDAKRVLFIIIGTFLVALATNGILIPNKLLSGGVSGIAIFLHFLFNWNISMLIIVINIPLFILALIFLKRNFILYSLFGMLMLSFWIEVTHSFVIPTKNILSVILVAGVLHGVGTGIIFRGDGSTAGMDIIAKILNKYFSFNMATVNFALNGAILLLSIYKFGLDLSVLTIATMFISSQITNFVVDGINYKRTLFIITNENCHMDIASDIMEELHRGVTILPATGAYTHQAKYILYTTVGIREVAKAKQIILYHDPKAFMTVSETAQVIGNGRGFAHFNKD